MKRCAFLSGLHQMPQYPAYLLMGVGGDNKAGDGRHLGVRSLLDWTQHGTKPVPQGVDGAIGYFVTGNAQYHGT